MFSASPTIIQKQLFLKYGILNIRQLMDDIILWITCSPADDNTICWATNDNEHAEYTNGKLFNCILIDHILLFSYHHKCSRENLRLWQENLKKTGPEDAF